ncbi:M1 family metallopeptidase [Streptacidiphilus sp. EB129]|uniref:M1 family metallopeptidase n=1 Tax=Streptacidiphilus sp. EB129 TaxID=3156262 RepID=UPI003513535F
MITRRLLALAATPVLAVLLAGASQGDGGTPGAAGAGDPYFPQSGDGGYHVVHYGLTLAYTPATRLLEGSAQLTSTATQDLSSFDLDLSGLTVSAVTVDGKPAAVRRTGVKLQVTPADWLPKGRTFHTTVEYRGVPVSITDPDNAADGWIAQPDGSVFVAGEPQGAMTWFPSNNHPLDKSAYDITVTVPDGWTAVGNGRLLSQRSSGGRSTFSWHQARPMAAYLATAAIGRFQVAQTWTAAGLPVYNAVDPREAKAAAPVLAQLPDVIAWESSLFGAYPFDAAGAIVEHVPTVDYALETQSRPIYNVAPDIDTLVHETAHQWFGDSVSLESWRDIWLNEGFATYTEWLWDADHGGPGTAQRFAQYAALPAGDDVWAFPPGDPGDGAHLFATPPYARGAMVLEQLRRAVGDPVFFGILKSWAAEHRYGHGDTAGFVALCETRSGKDLDGLFATWLYGQGKPAQPGAPAPGGATPTVRHHA